MQEQEDQVISKWKEKLKRGFLRVMILHMFSKRPDELLNGNLIRNIIKERTSDNWLPSPGSIYPILSEMESDGIIEEIQTDNDKNRDYRITDFGIQVHQTLLKDIDFMGPPNSFMTRFVERLGEERLKKMLSTLSIYDLKLSYENTKLVMEIHEELLQKKILEDKQIL